MPNVWVVDYRERDPIKREARQFSRSVLAVALLAVRIPLIYALGAGYFGPLGIGFPTPWNYAVTVVLGLALLLGVWLL